MLGLYEFLTIFLLLIAGVSGIFAIKSLGKKQKRYSLRRLIKSDEPFYENKDLRRFLLYAILTLSTASAFLAAYLRLVWLKDMGWESTGDKWGYWWLTSHAIDAIVYTGVHLLVYMKNKRLGVA